MSDCRVTCIIKKDPMSSYEHITHIGNPSAGWVITREQAIDNIESKVDSFYVSDPVSGHRADVGVVRESGKLPYLRTHADGHWNDNLLSLNQCPLN